MTSGPCNPNEPKASQTKKNSTRPLPPTSEDRPEPSLNQPPLDLARIQARVFRVAGNKVFIGGQELTPDIRGLLRDQSKYIITSQLWEVFNAAIINESADLALVQSEDWEHIIAAKMLHHWGHVFRNALYVLAKD